MENQPRQAISTVNPREATSLPMLCEEWGKSWKPQNLDKRLRDGFPTVFKAGCGLSVGERAGLEATINQAREALKVMPSEEDITRLLSLMFNVMKSSNAANDPEIVAVVYRMVVEGICYSVLEAAVKDIINGRAEGLSKIFFPTSAEFRHYCDKLEGKLHTLIRYAQGLLDAPEEMGRGKRVSPDRLKALMDVVGGVPLDVPRSNLSFSPPLANQTRH